MRSFVLLALLCGWSVAHAEGSPPARALLKFARAANAKQTYVNPKGKIVVANRGWHSPALRHWSGRALTGALPGGADVGRITGDHVEHVGTIANDISRAVISPDDRFIATAGPHGVTHVHDLSDPSWTRSFGGNTQGTPLVDKTLTGVIHRRIFSTGAVSAIAFDATSRLLALGSVEGRTRVYERIGEAWQPMATIQHNGLRPFSKRVVTDATFENGDASRRLTLRYSSGETEQHTF